MTTKKDQRWAIIPPGEPSPDDVTQTHRRVRSEESGASDPTTSRRRARTQPEAPDLNELAQQVAPSTPLPRPALPRSTSAAPADPLSSPSREALTAPPETSPTMMSPLDESESSPRATLIDLPPAGIEPAATPTIVERSRATGPIPNDGGETLPSPPWRDDEP